MEGDHYSILRGILGSSLTGTFYCPHIWAGAARGGAVQYACRLSITSSELSPGVYKALGYLGQQNPGEYETLTMSARLFRSVMISSGELSCRTQGPRASGKQKRDWP